MPVASDIRSLSESLPASFSPYTAPERRSAVVNQRLELRATNTNTRDLGSWISYTMVD